MSVRKRLSAMTALGAAVAIAAPAATAGAQAPPTVPGLPAGANAIPGLPTNANGEICLQGITDLGPFGPMGPYGPNGPYGEHGPLHGQPNPIGDAATCGGLITYLLRGGDLASFVNGNIASAAPGR
jgi:hypothetical protein